MDRFCSRVAELLFEGHAVEFFLIRMVAEVKKFLALNGTRRSITVVGFEIFTAVVMKIAIFWDTAPCSPYMNRRFGGTYHLIFRVKNQLSKKPA
jgi:hypothetical protein